MNLSYLGTRFLILIFFYLNVCFTIFFGNLTMTLLSPIFMFVLLGKAYIYYIKVSLS